MRKLQTFWYVLKNTFTSPSYYRDILKAPFNFSLKFFYFYFLFFSLFITCFISAAFIPLHSPLKKLPDTLTAAYPKELVITVRKGQASTNVNEPYAIPLSQFKSLFNEKDIQTENKKDLKNLLVIDTKKGAIEDFNQYQTVALLTKNHISYIGRNSQIESQSLSELKDFSINKETVKNISSKVAVFIPFILPMLILLVFIGTLLFLPFAKLLYLVFGAFLIWITAKILSRPLSYKKSYQIGLHLIIVVSTFFGILSLFTINLQFPFAQSLLLIILTLIVLPHNKTAKVSRKK